MAKLRIGIDPGIKGALAFVPETGKAWVIDMPTSTTRSGKLAVSATGIAMELRAVLADNTVEMVTVEDVHAMPGQGVTSMFTFGRGLGAVEGVVTGLGLPMSSVTPQAWKRAAGIGANKVSAIELARRLYPECCEYLKRKCDDGRAEALLLAGARRQTWLA